MSQELVDTQRLQHLEAVVSKGLANFIEVGNALTEIRQDKLFLGSHKSFESYVKDKFQMSRSRAYQLIEAAEVKQELDEMSVETPIAAQIVNESQIRELAKVDSDVMPEVVKAAVTLAGQRPLTARHIKLARKARLDSPEEAPEVDETFRVPDDDPVTARARGAIPDLVKRLRFHLGNLQVIKRFDGMLKAIEECAR